MRKQLLAHVGRELGGREGWREGERGRELGGARYIGGREGTTKGGER